MTTPTTTEPARVRALLVLGLATAAALAAGPAMAQDLSAISDMFTNIITALTGPVGQGLATIAVIGSGIACLLGRLNFGWFASVLIGVAVIFGGPGIVADFAT